MLLDLILSYVALQMYIVGIELNAVRLIDQTNTTLAVIGTPNPFTFPNASNYAFWFAFSISKRLTI